MTLVNHTKITRNVTMAPDRLSSLQI